MFAAEMVKSKATLVQRKLIKRDQASTFENLKTIALLE